MRNLAIPIAFTASALAFCSLLGVRPADVVRFGFGVAGFTAAFAGLVYLAPRLYTFLRSPTHGDKPDQGAHGNPPSQEAEADSRASWGWP